MMRQRTETNMVLDGINKHGVGIGGCMGAVVIGMTTNSSMKDNPIDHDEDQKDNKHVKSESIHDINHININIDNNNNKRNNDNNHKNNDNINSDNDDQPSFKNNISKAINPSSPTFINSNSNGHKRKMTQSLAVNKPTLRQVVTSIQSMNNLNSGNSANNSDNSIDHSQNIAQLRNDEDTADDNDQAPIQEVHKWSNGDYNSGTNFIPTNRIRFSIDASPNIISTTHALSNKISNLSVSGTYHHTSIGGGLMHTSASATGSRDNSRIRANANDNHLSASHGKNMSVVGSMNVNLASVGRDLSAQSVPVVQQNNVDYK